MELKLEKFKKLDYPIKAIIILFLGYFFIPGALKISIHSVIFRYEDIFFSIGILFILFYTYKKLNNDQKKLFLISNSIIIFTYFLNLLYFYLIGNLYNDYLILSFINGYIYLFSLLNLFLLVFFFNNKTELFLDIIYYTGIFLVLEFLIFIFLSDSFIVLQKIYNNSVFDFNSKKYILFRSVFIGDHITTSLWSMVSLLAGIVKIKKKYSDYLVFFLLIIIIFFNIEARLNIGNALFCFTIMFLIKFFKIKLNLKVLGSLVLFYFFITIIICLFLYYFYPLLINLNSFTDRIVLNIFNLDTYFKLPISLGFDNLKFFYIENQYPIFKDLIYFMNLDGNGVGTISSLGSDLYFKIWNAITSPHNILITYLTTMGLWFFLFLHFFNRFSDQNFKHKQILLLILFNIIIFSFWNQIWRIDLLFILIISLIMNEGLNCEKK